MKPIVSFVMPAYNTENYIRTAIDSILAQTERNWELVIVNDGSTDSTPRIADEYADRDDRIRVIHCEKPSGSVFRPRYIAICNSRADIISPLDSDDYIPPEYLANLLAEKEKYGAQAVYPMMHLWRDTECHPLIDSDSELLYHPMPGRDAVIYTLDEWEVNCNGGVIDKEVYMKSFSVFGTTHTYSHADEEMTRHVLFNSGKVVFTRESYYYRDNPSSVTRVWEAKRFDVIHSSIRLTDFIKDKFGSDSPEYTRVQKQLLHNCIWYMQLISMGNFTKEAAEYGKGHIENGRKRLESRFLEGEASRNHSMLMRMPLGSALRILTVKFAILKTIRVFFPIYSRPLRKIRYLAGIWKDLRSHSEEIKGWRNGHLVENSESARLRNRHYTENPEALKRLDFASDKKNGKRIICPFDGFLYHGGPTDRLRGILSVYAEASRRGIPLYLSWTSPFNLEDYLIPAVVDWRIDSSEISRDASKATPFVIQDLSNAVARRMLGAAIDGCDGTLHVYSNADSSLGNYRKLYHKLFRPSPLLQQATDLHLARLGRKFWVFTFRFQGQLGDFLDWGESPPLPPCSMRRLMEKCRDRMLDLMRELPDGYRVLVTSDSRHFLDFVSDADERIYITPGGVQNIDIDRKPNQDAWLKTFTDQQLIMHAEKVFRMMTGNMYPTGFPKFAAEIGGAEFIDHRF